ncbi:wd repeat-containing protein [Anaeramoeba ignava]|uniref:WD repeat-containing protein 37 n=1 Tax=Anaeramoeba ignava TaxID=1746090 RepID=A0A9Q0L6G4_ANAIG|nr:wd repeat-containing protein [Anaeramoeba ignava]|eukprot:Anaeramoba_ignava/c18349_g1_i1.p1 GENE.c18349_g1_i1~~c18349_g1_i1.p1  ORF type:complete len:533 (+),score=166.51 c18349_g1_i1:159-1757(+)
MNFEESKLNSHLQELFSEIEKEFKLLWNENQELKKKIDSFYNSDTKPKSLKKTRWFSKSTTTQKWDIIHNFCFHRDIVWEVTPHPQITNIFGSSSADRIVRIWDHMSKKTTNIYTGHKGSVNSIRFHPKEYNICCTSSGDKTCHIWKYENSINSNQEEEKNIQNSLNNNANIQQQQDIIEAIQNENLMDNSDDDNLVNISEIYVHSSNSTTSEDEMDYQEMNQFVNRPEHVDFVWGSVLNTEDEREIDTEIKQANKYIESQENKENKEIKEDEKKMDQNFSFEDYRSPNSPPFVVLQNILPQESKEKPENIISSPLVELKGHKNAVTAADFLFGSGDTIVTSSLDSTLKLWTIESGNARLISTLVEHQAPILNVVTHHKEPLILSSSKDTTFRLWDLRTKSSSVIIFNAHTAPVRTSLFAPKNDYIVSGGDDKTVKIWDQRINKEPIASIHCVSGINKISISPQTSQILTPLDKNFGRIYDLSGKVIGKLKAPKTKQTSMLCCSAWDANETKIMTGGSDSNISMWEPINITN